MTLWICCQLSAQAQEPLSGPKVSYQRDIEPIFRMHCQGCHQPAKPQGGYVITDTERLFDAGETGDTAVVRGNIEASHLLRQIRPVDGQAAMPKNLPALSAAEIELIEAWIQLGAEIDVVSEGLKFSPENPPVYTRPAVITALEFSRDGRFLAVNGIHEVLLMSTADWQVTKRLIGLSERIESVAFSPDSSRLAVTGGVPGRSGEVQIWDVASGELLISHQVSYDSVYGGCFSPNGKLVAFGCTDNTVRAIDAETGQQVLHQGAHEDWIRSVVFNPDGTHLLSAGRDMTVKLTEVVTERFVDNVTSITPGALRGGINSLAMHPSRNEVLVGGADGSPKIYRIFRETERRIGDDANLIRQFPSSGQRIFSVELNMSGTLFASAGTLDGHSRVQVYPYDFDSELPADVKVAMAKRVTERSDDEKKIVEEYQSKTSPAKLEMDIPTSLYAVAFSPTGALAVGGSDGRVRMIDVDQNRIQAEFTPMESSIVRNDVGSDSTKLLAPASGLPVASVDLPNRIQEQEQLSASPLTRLDVLPTQVNLHFPTDYVQLVVTGTFADGQQLDLTRLVKLEMSSPHIAQLNATGLLQAEGSGNAILQVAFGGQSSEIPVCVDFATTVNSGTDFVRDVNPILSRLGCNQGTCHGAQKGKNGFKLSLRGYDPVEDIRALSDDLCARRLNIAAPGASLMLQKTVGAVPHEGGVLMSSDSVYFDILRRWIAEGAQLNTSSQKVSRIELFPTKPVLSNALAWQQFRVIAHYPDGRQRDVTHESFVESGNSEVVKAFPGGRVQAIRRGEAPVLVRYEGAYAAATVTVMGDRSGFEWSQPSVYNTIDDLVASKWQRMKIAPSDVCDDFEFLRRVRLDLTGLPPSVSEINAFTSDPLPSRLKRQLKIDELLASEDYVDHWSNKWADLLQVNSKFLGTEGARSFRDWIRSEIKANTPFDEFARKIITADGSNRTNPAASYYKILRDPDLIMENTTHLFMAVRFNCNKCHDHPFERWTQDQYYALAAYFSRIELQKDPESGDKKVGGTAVEVARPLYEIVAERPDGEMTHQRTGKIAEPHFPFDVQFEVSENATRREQLAAWMTSGNNPYFARSLANRIWGYLTGTGLMMPLDDIRAGNPPTNPELMDWLTAEFIDSGFDVQHVLRMICNSRTYQLSVASNRWNQDDQLNYSHALARRLPAEVLYDAVYHVTGAVSEIPGVEPGTRAAALPDVAVQLPDGFLNNLGRPVRESACECERSQDLQLGPVMALVSGPTVGKAISDPKCELAELAGQEASDAQLVRDIYLRVLNREATEAEITQIVDAADQIPLDHQELKTQLAEREAWWVGEREQLEIKRLNELKLVETQIADRKREIAPERERLAKERELAIQAAETKLAEQAVKGVPMGREFLMNNSKQQAQWYPLMPEKLKSTNKCDFVVQPDRSIVASGNADKGTYTLTFRTSLKEITGLRLEALPLDGSPGGGPGLSKNGNFVITEIEIEAASQANSKESHRVELERAIADFSQDGFDPQQVFDNQNRDQRGWAVSPRGAVVHWLNLQFKQPLSTDGDCLLTIQIHQYHNAEAHRLAHFRLSATTDTGELGIGLPEEFAVLQTLPEKQQTEEAFASLVGYLKVSDKEWLKLQADVADAKRPLAEDVQLTQLSTKLKQLSIETPDDLGLVQLRHDFEASSQQMSNRRLTLAQDLTWALINSPAFLFNH